MNPVKIPRVMKALWPDITWDISTSEPDLFLTFDDGPTPGITEAILSVLSAFAAKATFFCIGRNTERHFNLYQQILDEGHSTGNHTYSHLKGWFTPNPEYYADVAMAAKLIHSHLYRPPYGMITPSQLYSLKKTYRIVMWNIMSFDFSSEVSPEKCLKNIINNTRKGSVIVFHDSVKASGNVLYALPRLLEHFTSKGFHFRPIPNINPSPSIYQPA
jgi:peptidoglycan/xylan/chitin deacetylase (PgdA/CDA1 family)